MKCASVRRAKQDRLVDAEDYSSSGAKLTWRLINKASSLSPLTSNVCHPYVSPYGTCP